MKEWLDRAFLPMITSVVNLRPLTALRNGMTYTIPIIIVGRCFSYLLIFLWITSLSG